MIIITAARWDKGFKAKETKQIKAFHGVKAALKELEELRNHSDLSNYQRWEIDNIEDTAEYTEEVVLHTGKCQVRVYTDKFRNLPTGVTRLVPWTVQYSCTTEVCLSAHSRIKWHLTF